MTIVQGYVRDENNNLLPDIKVCVFKASTDELIGGALTGDGITPLGHYEINIDYSGEIYVTALTGLNNSGKNHLIKRAVLP